MKEMPAKESLDGFTRSGHQITFEGKAHLPEQDDAPVIEGQA